MACAKPAVVYGGSGPAEIVVDGRTGFVVEPDDMGQLVQAVIMLADHRQRRRMMGTAALDRFRRLFTVDRFVEQTARVLSRTLESPALSTRASA